MDTLPPPKKLENLEKFLVNGEMFLTKQSLLILGIEKLAKIRNMLYKAKQSQEASMLEVTKSIRFCADIAMY